jgi:hypothetical protein
MSAIVRSGRDLEYHPRQLAFQSHPRQLVVSFSIPPAAAGGIFRSFLLTALQKNRRVCGSRGRKDLKHPPTAVGGIRRKDLKHPPTAVGGIRRKDLKHSPTAVGGIRRKDLKHPPTAVGGIRRKDLKHPPTTVAAQWWLSRPTWPRTLRQKSIHSGVTSAKITFSSMKIPSVTVKLPCK